MTGPIIHHVAISTPDLERSLDFYRDLLGFEVVFDGGWPPGTAVADAITGLRGSSARQVLLKGGNAYLELFQYETPSPRPGQPDRPACDHGITHLCVDVEDIDAEYARLSAAGMLFHDLPQDVGFGSGVRTIYGRDPDGNIVEIQEIAQGNHRFGFPALSGVEPAG